VRNIPAPCRFVCGAIVALVAVALAASSPGAPPRALAQEGAITLEVTPAFEGNYAPDRWLPLLIVLRNGGPAARVEVAAAPPLARARNLAAVEVPGGGEVALTLYAAMDRSTRELVVSATSGGAPAAEQRVPVRPREGERMLALVDAQPFTLSLPRRQDLAALPFLPFAWTPAQLPDHPAGLSSLALVVAGALPPEGLAPAQLVALHAWVRAGGHLVVGGGPDAAATVAALPAELRVAEPGAAVALDPAPLGAYAGVAPPAQLPGVALSPAPDAVAFGPAGAPLWASRAVGAGRVTQLAFDPGLEAVNGWAGAPALWDRLLAPPRVYTAVGADMNADGIQAQTLGSALANLPPINLPNATPLFVLLAVYAVLIGPGLALLLRRLDRQALGWAVLPAVALGVTAIAGGLAVASRADQRLASQITLVEQVDATTARARASLGILTPRDERYDVSMQAGGVARPLPAGAASFGAIDSATGTLGQEGEPLALAVDAWELQGALAEALVPLPALDAELRVGADGIVAAVSNTTGRPLEDVAVAYAGRAVSLGDLGPGESRSAGWPPPPPGADAAGTTAPLSVVVLGDALQAGRAPGSAPERRVLVQEALLNAASAAGPEGEGQQPLVLAWLAESPLGLDLKAPGLAAQQVSLLVARPRIVGAGSAIVPAGWMQIDQGDERRAVCTGPQGRGLAAAPAPLTMTLALPADMATFRAESASIELQSERLWPNAGVTTELYNWRDGAWAELDFDGPGALALGDAGPFVQGGRLRLRLGGRIEEAGCVFAAVTLRGELPPAGAQP
jgi:hypothetical protein